MDRARVLNEIAALADACESVKYDLEGGRVLLEEFPFPAGWTPQTGMVRFDLPRTYPRGQPSVYIEAQMRYHGTRPMTMLSGPGGWSKYCIHRLSDWEPRRHTLVTLTRLLTTSLNDPSSSNPLKGAP